MPQIQDNLIPSLPHLKKFKEQDRAYKRKQKINYNKRHRTCSLPNIPEDQPVWINKDDQQQQGTCSD